MKYTIKQYISFLKLKPQALNSPMAPALHIT